MAAVAVVLGAFAGFVVLFVAGLAIIAALIGGATPDCTAGSGGDEPIGGTVGSLGGVGGTGLSRAEVNTVRGNVSSVDGPTFTSGTYSSTAYGPPWGGIQGSGQSTAGGVRLDGGAPRKYMVAVDPGSISLGQWVYAQPNPFNWDGAFLAADTGGAINGKRLDFYDWRGRAYQNSWGRRDVEVTRAPTSPLGLGPGDITPSAGGPSLAVPPTATPVQSGPVVSVGDSLAVGTAGLLAQKLAPRTVSTSARKNLTSTQGLAIVRDRQSALAGTLLVQIGTNDGDVNVFRRNVRAITSIAARHRTTVFWVNISRPPLRGSAVTDVALNRVLDHAQNRKKLIVVDWKSLVATGSVDLDAAAVHPSGAGYEKRAQLIATALGAPRVDDAAPDATVPCGGEDTGGSLEGTGSPDALALANNPKIVWLHKLQEVSDLKNGRVSPKLISLLALVAQRYKIQIFALASDHDPGTNHEAGRAADIAIVDDDNCAPPNMTGKCWELAQVLDRIKGCLHPTELIYYFDPGPSPDSFAKSDHDDHIHVGYDGPLGARHYAPDISPCSPKALTG